jgi:hypothetical protein
MIQKSPDLEIYRDAIQQLEDAVAQIDQAHAALKDISLEWWTAPGRRRYSDHISITALYDEANSFLQGLRKAECDDCGNPISDHPVNGCKWWRR